jgi:hypothetical protein
MVKIFKLRLVTQKDFDALNKRIDDLTASGDRTKERQAAQAARLAGFAKKFYASMDFIGQNLPLKRKRKALFKIVKNS